MSSMILHHKFLNSWWNGRENKQKFHIQWINYFDFISQLHQNNRNNKNKSNIDSSAREHPDLFLKLQSNLMEFHYRNYGNSDIAENIMISIKIKQLVRSG